MRKVRPMRISCEGQSMVEFAVCLPLLLLLFTGILFFGRGYVLAERAGMAARYAAGRFAKDKDANVNTVKQTINNVFVFDFAVKKEDAGFGSVGNFLSFITSAGGATKTTVSIAYQPNYLAFNPGGITIGHAMVMDSGTWTYDELNSDSLVGIVIREAFGFLTSFIPSSGGGAPPPPGNSGASDQSDPGENPPDTPTVPPSP